VARENPATLLGRGALEALRDEVQAQAVDVVVFRNMLRPRQQEALASALGVKVLDRREVILDIFAQRALSREGKLQVELAQLAFRLGRLSGSGRALSRLGGGIGTRGPGEKKLEEDRRRIRTAIRQIERELAVVRRTRALHARRRRELGYPVVALVGYTNAGKSTLFNRLTGAGVAAGPTMFSTLDPTARRFAVSPGRHAILVDTVGFIHDLPGELLDAFLATLEGIGEADLLVHVVDGTSPHMGDHIAAVDGVPSSLGFGAKPALGFGAKPAVLAVNKCDEPAGGGDVPPGAVRISALRGDGVTDLLAAIEDGLWGRGEARSGSIRPG